LNDYESSAVERALRAMQVTVPRPLLPRVNMDLEELGVECLTEDELVEILLTDDVNDGARRAFYINLGKWSTSEELTIPRSAEATAPNSPERRQQIFRALGLPESADARLSAQYPDRSEHASATVIDNGTWKRWYPREDQSTFYWDQYRSVLRDKGFAPEAIDALDESTGAIIERLADPSQEVPYQSKGLVVGYVQSGKTANFAGTIAKAVDAGYKLVIVLTGTIELLRSQTQKRLDKELVGVENVLGGVATKVREYEERMSGLDPNDPAQRQARDVLQAELDMMKSTVDYIAQDDQDWRENKFARFGVMPEDVGAPRIVRLTGLKEDYKSLRSRLNDIDFDRFRTDRSKPIYAVENLAGTDVWLAVVKKNASTLGKLRSDLRSLQTKLSDIPAIIIDDEADQASVNTKKPKPAGSAKNAEEKERTKINEHIAGMLSSMPRCQYLAYTATPFANVFVDPVDSADIFPKDFIIALEPSPEYMGAKSYHDLDGVPDTPTFENSNRKAYYRPVEVDQDGMAVPADMASAMDAFVLSGAIKLWRRKVLGDPPSLKHHTMMVHEGAKQNQHTQSADRVRTAWHQSDFTGARGVARLRALWETDFSLVSAARADGAPVPGSFDEIKQYIGEVVRLVNKGHSVDRATNPVVIVNGSKDSVYAQEDINFDGRDGVWKILVGGTKLSRGFTVEGLTITVYTRVTIAADTLMQMGRWYGYRTHYRDLVRLYLGAGINKYRNSIDLYDAFTDIARDEEDFRSELVQFSQLDEDGVPEITPMDVAPLVIQRLPWLKPTGANKMYNSRIVEKGTGGKATDLFAMQKPGSGANTHNLKLLTEFLSSLGERTQFLTDAGTPYDVAYGVVGAGDVVRFLKKFQFFDSEVYASQINFIDARSEAAGASRINDFAVFLPLISGSNVEYRSIPGYENKLPVLQRKRREPRSDFSGSSRRQRVAVNALAGDPDYVTIGYGGPEVDRLRKAGGGARGSLMITLAADQKGGSDPAKLTDPVDPEEVVTLLTLAVPYRSAPKGIIVREVKNPLQKDAPIVDV